MAGTEMTTEVGFEKEKSSDNSTKLSEEETKQLLAVMRKAQVREHGVKLTECHYC